MTRSAVVGFDRKACAHRVQKHRNGNVKPVHLSSSAGLSEHSTLDRGPAVVQSDDEKQRAAGLCARGPAGNLGPGTGRRSQTIPIARLPAPPPAAVSAPSSAARAGNLGPVAGHSAPEGSAVRLGPAARSRSPDPSGRRPRAAAGRLGPRDVRSRDRSRVVGRFLGAVPVPAQPRAGRLVAPAQ